MIFILTISNEMLCSFEAPGNLLSNYGAGVVQFRLVKTPFHTPYLDLRLNFH